MVELVRSLSNQSAFVWVCLGGGRVHSFVHSTALFRTVFGCLISRKAEVRLTLDFIGETALFQVVEIRGVEPLTFSMPLRRSTN